MFAFLKFQTLNMYMITPVIKVNKFPLWDSPVASLWQSAMYLQLFWPTVGRIIIYSFWRQIDDKLITQIVDMLALHNCI